MSIIDERAKNRGHPRPNHQRIAALWGAYLGLHLEPHDVAALMVLLKMARVRAGVDADNWIDAAGYAEIGRMLQCE